MNPQTFYAQWDIHEPYSDQEDNKSVAVVGRLIQITPANLLCTLACVRKGCQEKHDVVIDSSLLTMSTCGVDIGSLVKVFGDLSMDADVTVLLAKMLINVESLNVSCYHDAVKLRNTLKLNNKART